ncbi:MAG: hypothetical protein ACREBQ_07705, partial [Nitrososphaerales archaeon]
NLIFYTLVLRAGALFFVPKFRHVYSPVKIIVFSLEILVVIAYIFAFSLTGDHGYFVTVSTIFPAWIASSFFILIPYFIVEFGISLHKGERLLPALTGGVLLLADSVFAGNFALETRLIPPNLAVLGSETISSVVRQPGLVSLGSFSSLVVTGAGVLFYVSILAYVAVSQVEITRYQGKYTFALLIMLIGNAVLVGWTFLFLVNQITNMFWILSVPGILLPLLLLVGFHGRQK